MKRVCATVFVLVLCLGVVLCNIATPAVELRKQLAGPPSEFSVMSIPDPAAASLRADSTFLPFTLKSSRGSYSWTSDYPVDTPEQITVTVLSPHKEQLEFWLKAPNDDIYHKVDRSLFDGPLSLGKSYYSSSFGIDGAVVPAYSYVFYNPPTGYWGIIINSTSPLPATGPHGYLLLDNLSNYKILSKLNSYVLEAGQEAGVTVQMIQENPRQISSSDLLPTFTTLQNVVTVAKLNVKLPSGQETSVPLHDDGLHGDSLANDGIYTASFPTATSGNYVFQPVLEGILGHEPFARSVSHLVGVSSSTLRLGNSASYRYSKDKSIVYFDIAVTGSSPSTTETVLAYAQVWGQSSTKHSESVPVAWVESIVDVKSNMITLQMHQNWVVLAKAVPPFTLKQITLQDKEINTILSQSSSINVKETSGQELSLLHLFKNIVPTVTSEITEPMKYGPRPAQYTIVNGTTSTANPGKLVLVHGYCSGEVWDVKQFTDAVLFTDYKKSRSQDQFALLIKKFAEEEQKLTSYGIVGHSQGGLASLHLKAYYWSGLDNAKGGRVIQSVGSPYKGCSLAGTLADLGGLFGVGCSSNNDLAPSGAQVWLSKVPKEAQEKVYYYTTQYDDSWFLAPACVTASGLVLHSPNDGTCEIKYSTPDKAGNNMGNTKKFCHTDGMNYPPQTKDAARNAILNKEAAR